MYFARPIRLAAVTLTLVMPIFGVANSGLGPSLPTTGRDAQRSVSSLQTHTDTSPLTLLLSLAETHAAKIAESQNTISALGLERDAAALVAAAAQAAAAQAAALAAAQAAAQAAQLAAQAASTAQAASAAPPTVTTRIVGGRTVRVTTRASVSSVTSRSSGSTAAAVPAAAVGCAASPGGGGSAPSRTSAGGVAGTTTGDIQLFSSTFNAIRAANCLPPISPANFRYDSCMESRLFWVAEDPSPNPSSAWGHIGTVRSDGVPSVGCDGNLAGGAGNSGATVAQKWWASADHRLALYRPSYAGSTGGVCIYFAMTHGGLPNDGYGYTRAAARWGSC